MAPAAAQARDTLYLDVLQHAAEGADRRAPQLEMLSAQSALRLRTIRNELLPALGATGSAQYLSDVPHLSLALPGGIRIPTPDKDQYDAYVSAREPLLDFTRPARTAVERAQVAESRARLEAALFQQRQVVNDAFFGILLADAQQASLDTVLHDLASRAATAHAREAAGAALRSEAMLIEAEMARVRQSRDALLVQREATRQVLSSLVGREIPGGAAFAVRGVEAPVAMDGRAADSLRARPEYRQFDRTRELLDARARALTAQDLPRLALVGRTGYGRPGLNPLGQTFDSYYSVGLQLEWTPWNWGRTKRDVEAQQVQARMVASDEAAFSDGLRRAAIAQQGQIAALEKSLADDDGIVALRERILAEARTRYDEGEMTSADYIARLTELSSATLDRDARRVRLHEARARYLTTIGREVR
jgi:outer membrane protein TolC